MDKKNFAFDKVNFILLAVGMLVVIIGFVLMSGGESTATAYDPGIFNARRIRQQKIRSLRRAVLLLVLHLRIHELKGSKL